MQNYEGLTLKYVKNSSKLIRTHTQPSRKGEGTRRQKTLLYSQCTCKGIFNSIGDQEKENQNCSESCLMYFFLVR